MNERCVYSGHEYIHKEMTGKQNAIAGHSCMSLQTRTDLTYDS